MRVKMDGEIAVAGLKQPGEVIRDSCGVPHIYARNMDDLFLAQGHVMAQDRLWQMEMWKRNFPVPGDTVPHIPQP